MGKIRIITDPIHGNIPISILESEILSTKIFNRLHNILQNSMAYKVYPSDQTTRFAHSLGVMKLSSDMFKYSIMNASNKTRNKFFEEARVEITELLRNSNIELQQIQKSIRNILQADSLILSEIPYIVTEDYTPCYGLLLQSIRLAGLLHDAGHLPFSHISEFILERIHDELKRQKEDDNEKLDPIDNFVYTTLENIIKKEGKIHEVLTRDVIKYIFEYELISKINDLTDAYNVKDYVVLDYLKVLMNIVLEILSPSPQIKQRLVFLALHEIISGDIDADRLDFVKRDGTFSGLLEGTGRADRILKLYTLYNYETDNNKFRFLPSIRSLSDVEQILLDRFKVYQYIVGHHKVIRFDYLLEKSVYFLFKEDLKRFKESVLGNEKGSILTNDALTNKLAKYASTNDTLLKIIVPLINNVKVNQRNDWFNTKMDMLFQIDDYWLLHYLRLKYLELEKQQLEIDNLSMLNKFILNELFTNSKGLVTLWKRNEEFYGFINKNRRIFYNFIENFINDISKQLKRKSLLTKNQHLTTECIIDIIDYLVVNATRYGWRYFSTRLEEILNMKMQEKKLHGVVLVASVRHKLKTGISDTLELYSEAHNSPRSAKIISPIGNGLNSKRKISKFFEVYYERNIPKEELTNLLLSSIIELLEYSTKQSIDRRFLKDISEDIENIITKCSYYSNLPNQVL